MVSAQVDAYLAKQAGCPYCGRVHRLKGRHEIVVRSLFGTLRLGSPRFHHCSCQGLSSPGARKSFSPLAAALPDRTLPERLYLESNWASLVSYGVTARLLEDVLPLDGQINANGIRRHTHRVARRCERDLLAEQDTEPRAEEWPADNIPPPKPAITVGLDGGYIRSHDAPNRNEGWFEVIAKVPNVASWHARSTNSVTTLNPIAISSPTMVTAVDTAKRFHRRSPNPPSIK